MFVVTIVLYRQDWFGKGDTYALVFWTIPLAVGLSVAGKTILNLFRKRSFILRVLLIILTAGLLSFGWSYCVALVLGPWMGAFSIPILYLWIGGSVLQLLFLDWLLPKMTEKLKTAKVILGLLSFPLTVIVVVVCMYLLSFATSYLIKPEKETYLIPNNFEGEFRVIYGEKCGMNPQYENDRRVLQIPENGLLIIQPNFQAGTIDHKYYLIDKSGNRRKIKTLWDFNQGPIECPGVLLGVSGAMGGEMSDGSSSTESPLAIHYTSFTVFNKDTLVRDYNEEFKFQQRLDSLTKALVDECRKKNDL